MLLINIFREISTLISRIRWLPLKDNQEENENKYRDDKKVPAENVNGKPFSECTVKSN